MRSTRTIGQLECRRQLAAISTTLHHSTVASCCDWEVYLFSACPCRKCCQLKTIANDNEAVARVNATSFGRVKRCILLFMWGGPSQLETWDLKPDAPSEVRGEFQPIKTNVPGIHISEHFPLLAQRTGKLCIVRSMTHTDVNHTVGHALSAYWSTTTVVQGEVEAMATLRGNAVGIGTRQRAIARADPNASEGAR